MNMKKLIKLITIICLILVAQKFVNAQIPKPYWAKNAIQAPESGRYIFVYGEGNGTTPEESKRKAFADAVVKGQYELGSVTISAQDIANIENGGLDAAMRFTNRQIKITCQTDPLIVENSRSDIKYKTFVLIQMSIYADKSARFYDLPKNWDCMDENYYKDITLYNGRINKLKKAKEKEEKRENDPFIQNGYNKYFSLALGNGITYGSSNIIGFAASYRFGGRFGIEPHIGLGWSRKIFNAISGYDGNPCGFSKMKLVYSVGINIFIYKGFYLGTNYSVNELFVVDHYYDDYDSRYYDYMHDDNYGYNSSTYDKPKYEEYVYHRIYGHSHYYSDRDDEIGERFDLDYYKGMSFLAGYKYYFGDKRIGACGYLDFGAGVKCYSETDTSLGFEKFDFAWSIGIGLAF